MPGLHGQAPGGDTAVHGFEKFRRDRAAQGAEASFKLLIMDADILRSLFAVQGLETGALSHRLIVIGRGPRCGTKSVEGCLNG